MKNVVLVLIILLSFTILFSAEFKVVKEIEENPMHLALVRLDKSAKTDINGDIVGLIIVSSGIKDLFVDSSFKQKQEYKDGDYYIYLSPGTKFITFKKSGFVNHKYTLRDKIGGIKSGIVYEMSIDEKFKQVSQIPIMITCNQNGAEVFVDGKSKGKIANKMLTIKIDVGSRKIKIQKDGFATQEITKNISVESNSFNFKLVPAMPAAVTINTKPDGATVYIENLKFGTTPKSSFFDAGTYSIRIEKENYETINEQITITEPETKKSYNLTDIRATLTIKTHKNATVTFNGKDYKGGIENEKVAPQVLQITVTMPKAETINRVITLKPKTNETREIYPEVQTGTVQVMTIPTTANIVLKGDGGEHYTATGRKTFIDVPVGTYELIVTAEKHKTHTENFRLTADNTVAKQINLEEGSDAPEGFVFVKGGTFQMGSNKGDSNEKPVHSVTLDDFYIGKYEVTQKAWKDIMGSNPSNWKGDNLPVEKVSWNDVQEFIKKLNAKTGLNYRLPTEAEWEYAARGGVKTHDRASLRYAGSNNIDEVAWYSSNSISKTHAVGGKKPNELGIYDMSGNVFEWCNDWYGSYSSSSQRNPQGASSGSNRVNRGGGWYSDAKLCHVANRYYRYPSFSNINLGFRLVRSSK